MHFPTGATILKAALVIIALIALWTVLKAVLKLTARIFAVGCLVLLALAAIAWALGWLS